MLIVKGLRRTELAVTSGMVGLLRRSWTRPLLSVLRIVTGFLFVVHGTQKMFGYPVAFPGGPVDLMTRTGIAGVMEVAGGALLIAGLFTRIVAFLLSGEMAAAYFIAHAPQGFWPLVNAGELAVLYCFLFLYFAAAGAGPFSLDAVIENRNRYRRPIGYEAPRPVIRRAS